MTKLLVHKALFVVHPAPKSQGVVWQVYAHVQSTLQAKKIRMVDFKVPFQRYYGVENYMNQLQLALRTDTPEQERAVHQFLSETTPFPEHPNFALTRKEESAKPTK